LYYYYNYINKNRGILMAKTNSGKKIVHVHEYKKARAGGTYKKISVSEHRRSTPNK
jgi:hypothetical protein